MSDTYKDCAIADLTQQCKDQQATIDKLVTVLSELTDYAENNIPTFNHIYDAKNIRDLINSVKEKK